MSNIYEATEIQVEKPRCFPNNSHGNVLKVSQNGIISIRLVGAVAIVTYAKDGKQKRFAVRDYLHANLTDIDSSDTEVRDALICQDCGEKFESAQGLAGHRRHRH